MLRVTFVKFFVVVNDEIVGPIIPGRGLHKENPLSPHLFILCTEGLTTLIRQAEFGGQLHCYKICRGAPILSHLLFIDECFLFLRAPVPKTRILKSVGCV